MTATPQTPDVVVVGAGPVGLVAACELARRGVSVRIIDKLAEPTDESRAIAVHARSLDMFDRMGIIDELVATGVKSTNMRMLSGGRQLFQVKFDGVDSAFPYSLLTAQTETERVLTDRLTQLGVEVDRGVELVELTQDDKTAALTLRRADGSTETLTTSWVVARRRRAQHGASPDRHQAGGVIQGRAVHPRRLRRRARHGP